MSETDTAQIPQELRSSIESELQLGERITWIGQPIPSRVARDTLPIVLFGIPVTGFSLFWTALATFQASKVEKASFLVRTFPLCALPFVFIGFWLLSSPYLARRNARLSAYVLTDRRAILVSRGWRGNVTLRSFEPEQFNCLYCKQHRDGSGNVVFAYDGKIDTDFGFFAVRDVLSVEKLVKALSEKSAGR